MLDASFSLYARRAPTCTSLSSRTGFAARLAELKAQGVRAFKIRERFERVKRGGEYLGMYALLCMGAHHHAGALGERHFRETEAGGLELLPLGQPDAVRVAIRLNVGVGYLIDSEQIIHGSFRTASS